MLGVKCDKVSWSVIFLKKKKILGYLVANGLSLCDGSSEFRVFHPRRDGHRR